MPSVFRVMRVPALLVRTLKNSKAAKFQAVILGDEQPAARAELLATGQGKDEGDGKQVKCFILCRRGCI